MRERHVVILSLVERGWQAAREASVDLQREGVVVVHLVKGWLAPSVKTLITPYPSIRILAVWRRLFWPVAWALLVGLFLGGKVRGLLVDNDRSFHRLQGWARRFRVPLVLVRQGAAGYEVWVGSQQISHASWVGSVGLACESR